MRVDGDTLRRRARFFFSLKSERFRIWPDRFLWSSIRARASLYQNGSTASHIPRSGFDLRSADDKPLFQLSPAPWPVSMTARKCRRMVRMIVSADAPLAEHVEYLPAHFHEIVKSSATSGDAEARSMREILASGTLGKWAGIPPAAPNEIICQKLFNCCRASSS